MPRTHLHSASLGLARTRLHANRGVRVEELKTELASTNNILSTRVQDAQTGLDTTINSAKTALSAAVTDTETTLTTRINGAQTALSGDFNSFKLELPGLLDDRFVPVVDKINALDSITQDVHSTVNTILTRVPLPDLADITPEQQNQIFLCIRTLNRVEDLVLDKGSSLAQNNEKLKPIRDDEIVQACRDVLPEPLRQRVTAVHRDFDLTTPEEAHERLERFWELQDLRRAIIEQIASQPSPTSDSAPQDDNQA